MAAFEDYLTVSISNGSNSNNSCEDIEALDAWSLATSQNLRQSALWSIVLIIAYVMDFVIGVVGNIVVILVILFKPPMRTVTNMFLLNLAIADLLVLVFCTPATLLANLFIPWILGSFMCKAVAYVQGVSVCSSAYSLVALSLDRWIVIKGSMERKPGISKNQAIVIILLIWMFSSLITLPWPFAFELVVSDCQIHCVEVWTNEYLDKAYFLLAHLLCCYLIPLLVIISSNVSIWCYVSHPPVSQSSSVSIRQIRRKTKRNVRKTISIVTSAFLISWLPLYVVATYLKFVSFDHLGEWEEYILSILFPCTQWLGILNSCVNPVIYAFVNVKFRKSFKSLLCSRSKGDQPAKIAIQRRNTSAHWNENSKKTEIVVEKKETFCESSNADIKKC